MTHLTTNQLIVLLNLHRGTIMLESDSGTVDADMNTLIELGFATPDLKTTLEGEVFIGNIKQLEDPEAQRAKRMIGKQFVHRNGIIYTVIDATNLDTTRKEHPISIVYMGANGKKWNRDLSDWDRSFTELERRQDPNKYSIENTTAKNGRTEQ